MGWKEGDPYPCTGFEPNAPVQPADADGNKVGGAIQASACFADWYLGEGMWYWRDGPPPEPVLPPIE